MNTIEDAIRPRIEALISKEGDLGRLAFMVFNTMQCLSLLSGNKDLSDIQTRMLSAMILEAMVMAIRTEKTERFPEVYAAAKAIMEDAENALNSSDTIKSTTDEIIKRMTGK